MHIVKHLGTQTHHIFYLFASKAYHEHHNCSSLSKFLVQRLPRVDRFSTASRASGLFMLELIPQTQSSTGIALYWLYLFLQQSCLMQCPILTFRNSE